MSRNLIPHPFLVARLGGVPTGRTVFASGLAGRRLRELRELREALARDKLPICDALAAHVPALFERDADAARALIRIRRDLFNQRSPSSALVERVLPHLSPECADAVGSMTSSLRALSDLAAAVVEAHARELDAGYDAALRACREPNLIHALALTNPQVHAELLRMLSRQRVSAKDRAQLCTRLGRYVLRAGRKTSPLSSFGLVALGHWNAQGGGWSDDGRPLGFPATFERRRQPRFAALDHVCLELLSDLARIDDATPVALNPGLRRQDGQFLWFRIKNDDPPESRTRGTWVARNTSRAAFVELLRRAFDGWTSEGAPDLAWLRGTIRAAIGDDGRRVDALIASAWGHGLLQPALPAVLDPIAWARAVCDCLVRPLRDEVSAALEGFLSAVVSMDRFDPDYTAEIERRFAEVLSRAGLPIAAERYRPLVFEDCMLPALAFEASTSIVDRRAAEFVALLRIVPILSCDTPSARLRRSIGQRFRKRYGAGGICVDTLDFIEGCAEAFDASLARSVADGEAGLAIPAPDDGDDPRLPLRRRMFGRLARAAARVGDGEEIVLDATDLERYAHAAEAAGRMSDVSKMFFLQPVETEQGRWWAVNHIYPGATCTISRFIPDDAACAQAVRDYLRAISEAGRYVELGGVFGFNANLHAIASEEVVAIPPYPPATDGIRSLVTLRLRHRVERDDLMFEDETGAPVNVFHLGILTPLLMPRTYQIVRTLCFSADRVEDPGDDLAQVLRPDAHGLIRIPRVRLGDLVLVRRSFAVRKDTLPDPALDDFAFYERFNDWADRHALPRRLFGRRTSIASLHPEAEARLPDWRSLHGKNTKPMPLDRDCPLMVRIFQKNLAIGALDVVFAEALPDPSRTPFAVGGEPVVGEFGIELTLKAT